MIKRVLGLGILVLLCLAAMHQLQVFGDGNARQADGQVQTSQPHTDGKAVNVTQDQIYQGNLVLVNKEYPVHKLGVQTDVVSVFRHKELVKGYGLLDNSVQLSERVAREFAAMVEAAKQDGVAHFIISSGYRDKAEQNRLYKEMGPDYALPAGYSEHNLGLALDIGSSKGEMGQAAEGKWLKQHAGAYGFILRYPKDKVAITGIQYEPWHFRFVGLPHSAIMQKNGFTLEEYLDFLKEKKTVSTTVNGESYEIAYYPVGKKKTIYVPANHPYEISGNNVDGVIVTVFP